MLSRRQCLVALASCLIVPLWGAVGARDAATTPTATQKTARKLECPANYQKGSPACKRAKANHTCPEQLGGKCLAKK